MAEIDKQGDRQTDKQTDRQTDKNTDGQTEVTHLMEFHFLWWETLPLSQRGKRLPLQGLHHNQDPTHGKKVACRYHTQTGRAVSSSVHDVMRVRL